MIRGNFFASTFLTAGMSLMVNSSLARKFSLSDYGILLFVVGAAYVVASLAMLGQAKSLTSVFFSDAMGCGHD